MIKKQLKALSGGGVSLVSIAAVVGYLNVTFNLGMGVEVVAGVSAMVGVAMYLVVYFIPNIDPSVINLDNIDLEAALRTAAVDYDIEPEVIKGLATFMKNTLKEIK